MDKLYNHTSIESSKLLTRNYSTSFSLGIKFLSKQFQNPIYSIYGFVRIADEIVDTFHEAPQAELLAEFRSETIKAIERKVSTNPVLHAFQKVVHDYNIEFELIDTFLNSMEMDLTKVFYNKDKYEQYILGSAEVVGLMCLRVFVNNDAKLYDELKPFAMKLGSAFQKINFLRDLKEDYQDLGRVYFPNVEMSNFTDDIKAQLEKEINYDFELGYEGIKRLPKSSRFGVYVAYIYYLKLLKRIETKPAQTLLIQRIRIPNHKKYALFFKSYIKHSFNLL